MVVNDIKELAVDLMAKPGVLDSCKGNNNVFY